MFTGIAIPFFIFELYITNQLVMAEDAYYEMSIDGKKTKLTEKMAAAQSTREKKIPVEVNGRIVRVMPHMLGDIKKFGGTEQHKVIKEPPKELLQVLPKRIILPRMEVDPKPLIIEEPEVKSEIEEETKPVETAYPGDEVKGSEPVAEVKAPVKKAVKKSAAKKK